MSTVLPLSLDNVSVRKGGHWLLSEVSTDFEADRLTIVLGPNGCGKTTLLRAIHGMERLRSGSMNYRLDTPTARQEQALVFQTPTLLRRSVLHNIAYPLLVRGGEKQATLQEATLWTEKVGLSGKGTLMANRLSGGERQKLAFARAMITKPQVLLLDEPTTNLDGQSVKEIEALLSDARANGTSIIMATHDLAQARRLADDVKFLNRGRLLEDAPATRFFDAPKSAEAKAFLAGEILV